MRTDRTYLGMALMCLLTRSIYDGLAVQATVFRFTKVSCESLDKLNLTVSICKVKAKSRRENLLLLKFDMHRHVTELQVYAALNKRANGWKPFLYNINLDVCRTLKSNYNPIGKLMFDLFRNYTNLNTCPFVQPYISLNVSNLQASPGLRNLPLPLGLYMLETVWSVEKIPFLQLNVSAEIVETERELERVK